MRQNHHPMALFFTVMLGLGVAQQVIAHSAHRFQTRWTLRAFPLPLDGTLKVLRS